MKLGILTYHSQPNYGGVLQAWALRKALEGLGHDAYVIDRYGYKRNAGLWGSWVISIGQFLLCLVKVILLAGATSNFVRRWKSYRFIHKHLRLTSRHFRKWSSLGNDNLGLDCVIVGSDQVWNASSLDSVRPYFLEGWKCDIPAISYAASIGLKSLPEKAKTVFINGLKRFSSISVREDDAVVILKELGFSATQVLDPVLLLDTKVWEHIASYAHLYPKRQYCLCYFMEVNWVKELPILSEFAKKNNCEVYIFVNDWMLSLRPTASCIKEWIRSMKRFFLKHVHLEFTADPADFVSMIRNAKWVVADSFHAVMFSAIFERNIRFVRPVSEFRMQMFRRIEGFVEKYTHGPVIADSVSTAIDSFYKNELITFDRSAITNDRNNSISWLRNTLESI